MSKWQTKEVQVQLVSRDLKFILADPEIEAQEEGFRQRCSKDWM